MPPLKSQLVAATLAVACLAAAAPAAAASERPLVIIVHQGESRGEPSYTANLSFEVFLGTDRVDLDQTNVTVQRMPTASAAIERTSLGIYSAQISYPPNTCCFPVYFVYVNGTLGTQNASRQTTLLFLPGPDRVPPRWDLDIAIVNPFSAGPGFPWIWGRQIGGGMTVVLEARTRMNGTLADPPEVKATLQCWDGISDSIPFTPPAAPLVTTHTAVGTYRASFTAPDPGNITRECSADFRVRQPTSGGGNQSGGTGRLFQVVPFPVFVWSRPDGTSASSWGVIAGGPAPLEGATVELHAVTQAYTLPNSTFVPVYFNETEMTDANGTAEVHFAPMASGMTDLWVNVSSAGRTVSVPILWNAELVDGGPVPFHQWPVSDAAFSATFLSPWPAGVAWFSSANYTMMATSHGVPLVNETLYAYPYSWYEPITFGAYELRTDEAGQFTFPVELNNSTAGGGFKIIVADANYSDADAWGEGPYARDPYPWWAVSASYPSDLAVALASNRTSSGVDVTVPYAGEDLPPEVTGWVYAFPCSEGIPFNSGYGSIPWGTLRASGNGSQFSGRMSLPGWYPSGKYCIYTSIGNGTWARYGWAIIEFGQAAPDPPPPSPTPQTTVFSALFDAGPWIVAILILAAVTLAAAMRVRRRAHDDEGP